VVAHYIGRGEDGTRDPIGNQEYLDDIGAVGYHALRRFGHSIFPSFGCKSPQVCFGWPITCRSEKNLRRTLWHGVRVVERGVCY
jgi:hypothetical protein